MELSIIVPTKNEHPSYLVKCLTTIINQTIKDYEVIIICDNNERNLDIIVDFSKNYTKLTYVINSHTGVASARNLGVKVSKGDYIAFADSDDFYALNKFEDQINFLNLNNHISVVGSNLYLIDDNNNIIGTRVYPQHHTDIKNAFLYNMPVANPSITLRRSDFIDVGHFDTTYRKAEDLDLWLRFLKNNKKFHNLQNFYVYYRTPKDLSQKRGKIHYSNYAKTLTTNSPKIWPIYKWLFPVMIFNIIKYLPNSIVSILLNTKLIHAIKKINL